MAAWKKFCLILLLALAPPLGCTALKSDRGALHPDGMDQCREFFHELDAKVDGAGVRDASSFPVPGFPYLRTSRFLAALKSRLRDKAQEDQWIRLMAELSLEAREKEVLNLPDDSISVLAKGPSRSSGSTVSTEREALLARVRSCSIEMLDRDRARPSLLPALVRAVEVPDEYSFLKRSVGLYPVLSLPIAAVSEKANQKIQAWYDARLQDLPVRGHLESFALPSHPGMTQEQVRSILERSRQNPLGIPQIDESGKKALVEFFAPVFIQDVGGAYDSFGRATFSGHGLEIDTNHPTVYNYLTYAFLHGRPALQINYVIWYPERTGKATPWMERGRFDGLTVRVSLDWNGRVLMVDIMSNCGCYHVFIPRKEDVALIRPKPMAPDALVPQWLPEIGDGERLGVRVNSGWHQVERVLAAGVPRDAAAYELAPYGGLESLPTGGGRHVSMFDGHGIVEGSERIEPFILFSAGIRSIGSMRQRGHHAIELIGREHFDDPYLFQKNFLLR